MFKILESYPNYSIYENGIIVNNRTNRQLEGTINNSGYKFFRLRNFNGETKTIGLHRLLAACFIENLLDTNLIVNHKDGNKLNNNINNLEWCTYQENTWHAGKMKLTEKCKPLTLVDSTSGNYESFNSCLEASEFLNISEDSVLYRKNFGYNRVFPDGYFYVETSELKPGYLPVQQEMYFGRSRRVVVLDIILGSETFFDNVGLASDYLDVNFNVLFSDLERNTQRLFSDRYICKFDDGSLWRLTYSLDIERHLWGRGRAVVLFRDEGYLLFKSLKEVSDFLNVGSSTINYRLTSKNKQEFGGYYFWYLDEAIMNGLLR